MCHFRAGNCAIMQSPSSCGRQRHGKRKTQGIERSATSWHHARMKVGLPNPKREAVSHLMFLTPEVVVLVEVNPAAPQLPMDKERKCGDGPGA